ncbi:MAG: UDP-N-acetylmuramate--L-alanine ligase [Cyclobacteriaceae bacterium]|nr:UDP-N-acetylmuramate--L-alanine ligase [Cyclobacteriaceae bacterium]
MTEDKKHIVYLLGIGGIGMSALAFWFHTRGMFVAGYDKNPGYVTNALLEQGISVVFDDIPSALPPEVLSGDKSSIRIIYTPAIPQDSQLLRYFREHQYKIQKRSEVLGDISSAYPTIAVAGTHGKTTTSSMIAHVLHRSDRKSAALLGGILSEEKTNYLCNATAGEKISWFTTEADEFDRSFHQLHPVISVVTSLDIDHMEVYRTFDALSEAFSTYVNQTSSEGICFLHENVRKRLNPSEDIPLKTYGIVEADILAENIDLAGTMPVFDYVDGTYCMKNVKLSMPGMHNVLNATVAIAVLRHIGLDEGIIRSGLESFAGIRRRFEFVRREPNLVFIDDYAHHPEEIRALLLAVKAIYPNKKCLIIFQPHLYSRTQQLAREFAESLSIADEVAVLPVYPAREQPISGVDADLIVKKLQPGKSSSIQKNELDALLRKSDAEVIVTAGAGDIEMLVPHMAKVLEQKLNSESLNKSKRL